ncbi:uncharacterized protein [Rutidosis leptorrhynchoides]|uniref:uncharacterized protein n=1 Tax=Rutidosis leptorrhynchoides TaxID=125765 RepID=UPI003A9969BE
MLSKILANKIRKIIPWLLGDEQSTFISDRYILDGVLVTLETLDDLKAKKKKSFIFKVDFEKAFYCIEWNFLTDIMTFMSFGIKWIKWIQSCLTSTSISVLVNGLPTDQFSPKRIGKHDKSVLHILASSLVFKERKLQRLTEEKGKIILSGLN